MTLDNQLVAPTPNMDASEQPRLMIIDDEVESAQALSLYLTRQGFDVRLAYTGKAALKEIADFQPHLIICDLMIPDMDGFAITMHIRSDPALVYLPVIMITAHDEERKRLQSMISGADDYIAKPVNELELLIRVQALLRTKLHIDRLWQENAELIHTLKRQNAELENALAAVEEANVLKHNILNTVSHEMGTPMLQIKSAIHLIVEDIRKIDPDNMPAQLVTKATARLEGIISNVTDLARSENLKLEPLVLSEAIDQGIRNLERTLTTSLDEDRITRDIPPDLPPVLGDRRGVGRIITLLLDNALKFDPEEHPVTVSAKRSKDKKGVRVTISDRGIGIPSDKMDAIFEEFYQIDSSSTRRFGGSGVGLALARLLADQMHTKIEVSSKVGKGSQFSFELFVAEL